MSKKVFIKSSDVRGIIKSSVGTMFSVCFIKKNGEKRILNGRLGVKISNKGNKPTTAHINKYVVVYDIQKKDEKASYRNVNTEKTLWVKSRGVEYIVKND